MRLPLLVAAVLLAAGCLSPAPTTAPSDDAAAPLGKPASAERAPAASEDLSGAIASDHGAPYLHAARSLHEGSYGMELVGYNPLTIPGAGDPPEMQDGAYIAMDLWNDTLACVAHFVGGGGAMGGATIVDITDPANPTWLSSVSSPAWNSDCQFTDDGRFLLLGTYLREDAAAALPVVGEALRMGLDVFDVTDPKQPKLVLHDEQGMEGEGGADAYHNLYTAKIGGTNWIVQTYTGNVLKLAEDGSSVEIVATVEHTDHDMWVGKHPVTGRWSMVTGAYPGTVVYDFEDPTDPALLSTWEAHDGLTGWHRQWPLAELVEGRALMVVAGEECDNGKSLPYTVLDWTDPEDIVELGNWIIPGAPEVKEPGMCTMNSHEFETWNGYVATGNYHAGVWLIDIGTMERARAPATIGYYEPHEDPVMHGGAPAKPFAWAPYVWGAYFDSRGYVYAADQQTGLYVLKFAGTRGE